MLGPDRAVGRPSLELSKDQVATAIDLICCGVEDARVFVTPGMLEVPITVMVRKSMRRLKSARGLTNMEIVGEHELLDVATTDQTILGRIDIVFRFAHQFGDETAYLGVECKRVAPGNATLNTRYVTEGVARFASGKYAQGHHLGVMLGYVVRLPMADLLDTIDTRLRSTYGDSAACNAEPVPRRAVGMMSNVLSQSPNDHRIRLLHIFVDLTVASA
jgi:hypothetical protein